MPPFAPPAGDENARTALMHSRLLGERAYLHTYIRLAFAAVIIAGTFFAKLVLGIDGLDVGALVWLGVAVGAYNAGAYYLTRHRRDPSQSLADHRVLVITVHGAIVLDYLALTVAIWLVGGIRSPFVVFYLPHAAISCVMLTRRAAFGLAGLAYVLLAALIVGEWTGVAPPRQPLGAILGTGPLDLRYVITVLAVYGGLLVLIVSLLTSFTERVRRGEAQVRQANLALEQLSTMRRDFLHIALHNIQSPVGAVTMHLKNMNDGLGGAVTPKQQQWIDRSLKRLDGLNEFLQNFRMLNSLESGEIDTQTAEVDIGAMLATLVEETREFATARGHTLRLERDEQLPPVIGVERLLREAAVNYIMNAIKYTPDGGAIVVRGVHRPPSVRIEVEDNGIGISEKDRAKLFTEFVRLNRVGTPVAEVAGSGLGLSIVRRVVEMHGGRALVESEPGRGSTFIIELRAAGRPAT